MTSIDITLKSRVIMHMITSTARRPNASTRSEPVECLSARAAGNGRVMMNDDGKCKLCVRWSACRESPSTNFRWHASSKKNRPS